MRLQVKVPLLVIITILFIGIISTGVLLYSQRRTSIKQFEETAQAVAGAIEGSLKQCMLLGDPQYVQEALVSIADKGLINKAALFSPDGIIAASSEAQEIGGRVNSAEVRGVLLMGEASMGFEAQDNQDVFHAILPVFNQPACHNCHRTGKPVLGAIEVTLDTTILVKHMKEETILITILGAATFILVGGGLALILKRTVLDRLSVLSKTAQRLSKGDYAARLAITAKDEIGVLAGTFNEMAASVERRSHEVELSHQQLAELNRDLEDKVQRRTKELSTMNTLLGSLSQSLDPNRMLKDALSNVLRLIEVEAGIVYVVDGSSNRLLLASELGLASDHVSQTSRLRAEEIAREVAKSGRPVEYYDGSGNDERGEFRSFVGLPLGSKTTLGVLTLASHSPDRFPPETVRLLSAMCDAIGIALENARAARSIEEANSVREQLLQKLISAQEEERRRIARELHDEASQSLAALAINLEDIADALPGRYKETRQRLAVLKERAVATLSGIRGLALELRPSALDDLGLQAAIDWYAKDYLKKRGLEVKIQTVGEKGKLPSYTETMLFRIVQEALANIVKHAGATRVDIELRFTTSKLVLQVEDNGKGFDVEATLAKGGMRQNLGIHGMMERATLLVGNLTIRSQPGQGTILLVEVPIGRENG
ncbi:MAG: GAF domain-containing protein [Dehalococcoidales bacterium]|nr:GAF domain-containing protein [Dehalococcoidales bacterium]